nr:retrotransposon protein, putative, Ty1-copia subclass [Tanacetum cinerariifolium]
MVLVYGAKPKDDLKVSCYADASFQTDRDDTKSQTGYVFVLNGGAVDWKSAKQSNTATSSTEAEYIAVGEASMEAVWMREFIDGLGDVMPSNKRPMEILYLGEAAYILGIKIIHDRSKRLIALSLSAYLKKIIKKFRMENFKKGVYSNDEKA